MRDRKLVVDESASRLADGIIVSQPYTFTKGAVVAEADLNRYAEVPISAARGWTGGCYTLTVEGKPRKPQALIKFPSGFVSMDGC